MPHSPSAIANEFVRLSGQPLSQMKMQKLAFIANGWNLAIAGEPLINESAEAWDNGPVYREIWDRIRDRGLSADGRVRDYRGDCPTAELSPAESDVINHVWRKYGGMSAFALSDLTHQPGTPWTDTYFWNGRNARIDNDAVRAHYRALALAGRAAA